MIAPGDRFGWLVAVAPTGSRANHETVWRWRCNCGREVTSPPSAAGSSCTVCYFAWSLGVAAFSAPEGSRASLLVLADGTVRYPVTGPDGITLGEVDVRAFVPRSQPRRAMKRLSPAFVERVRAVAATIPRHEDEGTP